MLKLKLVTCSLIILLVGLLGACSKNAGLSGKYEIDDFLDMIKPLNEFSQSISDVDYTDIEVQKEIFKKEGKILKEIGFKEGDVITLTGQLSGSFSTLVGVRVSLEDALKTDSMSFLGSYDDVGICFAIPEGTNITVMFEVQEREVEGVQSLDFVNGKVIVPESIDYVPSIKYSSDTYDSIITGKVVLVDDLIDSEEAWKDWEQTMSEFSLAASHSNKYILLEDEKGSYIAAYINTDKGPEVKEGDRISIYGHITDVMFATGEDFMDAGYGGYYIYK